MKLLALFAPEMHILICTHSNSAANLYVEGLHMEWNSEWEGDRWRRSEREEERMRNGIVNGMNRQDVEGMWSGEMAGGRGNLYIFQQCNQSLW